MIVATTLRPVTWIACIGLTAAGLFSVGATLSLFTGRHAVYSGVRMLVLGGLAGGITYLLGRLLGVVAG